VKWVFAQKRDFSLPAGATSLTAGGDLSDDLAAMSLRRDTDACSRTPWPFVVSILLGTFAVPAVRWPAERIQCVAAADEPGDGTPHLSDAELDVLDLLEPAGELRASAIAAALHISNGATYVRLSRMEARGLIRRAGYGTYTAALPS